MPRTPLHTRTPSPPPLLYSIPRCPRAAKILVSLRELDPGTPPTLGPEVFNRGQFVRGHKLRNRWRSPRVSRLRSAAITRGCANIPGCTINPCPTRSRSTGVNGTRPNCAAKALADWRHFPPNSQGTGQKPLYTSALSSDRQGLAHHLYPLGAGLETGQFPLRTAPCGPPSLCLLGNETPGCV